MNKRIRSLAEQADIVFGFDRNNDPEVICAVMDIEKFAELIVRQCAGIAHSSDMPSRDIKDYFGVKS